MKKNKDVVVTAAEEEKLFIEAIEKIAGLHHKHFSAVTGSETKKQLKKIAKAYDKEANVIYDALYKTIFGIKDDCSFSIGYETVIVDKDNKTEVKEMNDYLVKNR